MEKPLGFVAQGEIGRVCHLRISLWLEIRSSCMVWQVQ